jgi:flagellar assembly protein FliH
LSSLLKKETDAGITVFGFPVMERDEKQETIKPVHEETVEAEMESPEPAEPEIDLEDVFRKRLLELERRGQEIEKEAYGRGFAQGEKDGLEYGQKSVQVVKTQLEGIAKSLEELPGEIHRDYRNWLIQTSLRLARQIVQRELRMTPEIVADTVRDLLDEVEDSSTLTVYLNPLDLEFMEKRAGLELKSNGKSFAVKPDKNLERGGCRLESEIQLLDASIEARFKNLEKLFLSRLEMRGHPSRSTLENEAPAGVNQNGK